MGVNAGPQSSLNICGLYFAASMYVGNLMPLLLNLPLVSLFVSVLRILQCYLYSNT